jgi:hypothetical protein
MPYPVLLQTPEAAKAAAALAPAPSLDAQAGSARGHRRLPSTSGSWVAAPLSRTRSGMPTSPMSVRAYDRPLVKPYRFAGHIELPA